MRMNQREIWVGEACEGIRLKRYAQCWTNVNYANNL